MNLLGPLAAAILIGSLLYILTKFSHDHTLRLSDHVSRGSQLRIFRFFGFVYVVAYSLWLLEWEQLPGRARFLLAGSLALFLISLRYPRNEKHGLKHDIAVIGSSVLSTVFILSVMFMDVLSVDEKQLLLVPVSLLVGLAAVLITEPKRYYLYYQIAFFTLSHAILAVIYVLSA